jgi:hypothetical protein
VLATAAGVVTIDEWAACVAHQIREGAWQFATLYDFTRAEAIPSLVAFPKIVSDIEEVTAEHGQRGPVAMLAHAPLFESLRSYSELTIALPYRTEAFNDKASADAWVDRHLQELKDRPE